MHTPVYLKMDAHDSLLLSEEFAINLELSHTIPELRYSSLSAYNPL